MYGVLGAIRSAPATHRLGGLMRYAALTHPTSLTITSSLLEHSRGTASIIINPIDRSHRTLILSNVALFFK